MNSGRRDEAVAAARAIAADRALALAALGRMDEALNAGRAVPSAALEPLIDSPLWDPVREDPRFHAMVERLGFSQEYREGRTALERMRRQQNAGE